MGIHAIYRLRNTGILKNLKVCITIYWNGKEYNFSSVVSLLWNKGCKISMRGSNGWWEFVISSFRNRNHNGIAAEKAYSLNNCRRVTYGFTLHSEPYISRYCFTGTHTILKVLHLFKQHISAIYRYANWYLLAYLQLFSSFQRTKFLTLWCFRA